MATRFHSKVVRVKEMGGKVLVEFKEKLVDSSNPTEAVVDTNNVKMFDKIEDAEGEIEQFMAGTE